MVGMSAYDLFPVWKSVAARIQTVTVTLQGLILVLLDLSLLFGVVYAATGQKKYSRQNQNNFFHLYFLLSIHTSHRNVRRWWPESPRRLAVEVSS